MENETLYLWFGRPDDFEDKEVFERASALLSKDERSRMSSLQGRCLSSRVSCRTSPGPHGPLALCLPGARILAFSGQPVRQALRRSALRFVFQLVSPSRARRLPRCPRIRGRRRRGIHRTLRGNHRYRQTRLLRAGTCATGTDELRRPARSRGLALDPQRGLLQSERHGLLTSSTEVFLHGLPAGRYAARSRLLARRRRCALEVLSDRSRWAPRRSYG